MKKSTIKSILNSTICGLIITDIVDRDTTYNRVKVKCTCKKCGHTTIKGYVYLKNTLIAKGNKYKMCIECKKIVNKKKRNIKGNIYNNQYENKIYSTILFFIKYGQYIKKINDRYLVRLGHNYGMIGYRHTIQSAVQLFNNYISHNGLMDSYDFIILNNSLYNAYNESTRYIKYNSLNDEIIEVGDGILNNEVKK